MKIRIVFEADLDVMVEGHPRLYFKSIVGEDGEPITTFDDCWLADGDVEALELEVLVASSKYRDPNSRDESYGLDEKS